MAGVAGVRRGPVFRGVRADRAATVDKVIAPGARRKTTDRHCANGHAWTPDNTHWSKDGKRRTCMTCRRKIDKAKSERNRSIVPPPIKPVPAVPQYEHGKEPWREDYEYGLAIHKRKEAERKRALAQSIGGRRALEALAALEAASAS